jgi:hypothetical protein
MTTIFRTATKQAMKEIIEERSEAGRFGLLVTEEGLEAITDRLVDLFEMTLTLRQQTRHFFEPPAPTPEPAPRAKSSNLQKGRTTPTLSQNQRPPQDSDRQRASFPKTRNAAEVYTVHRQEDKFGSALANPSLPTHIDLKLPRRRVEMSDEERAASRNRR